jgi:hypothetical protein
MFSLKSMTKLEDLTVNVTGLKYTSRQDHILRGGGRMTGRTMDFSSINILPRCLAPLDPYDPLPLSPRCDSKINVADLIFTNILNFVRTESTHPLRTEMYEYKQHC